jgi:chemotaxis-related protein WspB
MLFLLFHVGKDRYVLDIRQVAEVLPLVNIKLIPQAHPAIAGVFNCRGAPVPVIDLNQLMSNEPAQQRFSTRIILVRYCDQSGQPQLLGLIAEHVKETVRRDVNDFIETGISADGAPYLGPVASDGIGLMQWVEVNKLLPADIHDLLFQPAVQQ